MNFHGSVPDHWACKNRSWAPSSDWQVWTFRYLLDVVHKPSNSKQFICILVDGRGKLKEVVVRFFERER